MDLSAIRDSLERLHEETFGWSMHCCAHDRGEAEDVLQTVYLKIIDGRARYREEGLFKTWLFAVVRTTAADHRRRRLFRRLRLAPIESAAERGIEHDPGQAIDAAYGKAQLATALVALPRRQQEILQLVFYHDMSLSEAATVMGISIGSVRTHYQRGKDRLRRWAVERNLFHDWR